MLRRNRWLAKVVQARVAVVTSWVLLLEGDLRLRVRMDLRFLRLRPVERLCSKVVVEQMRVFIHLVRA